MTPEQTLDELRAARVIAVLRSPDAHNALAVARELLTAGLTALEITFTTPDAAHVLRELTGQHRAVLGAGTLTNAAQAHQAADAGARFLVSPGSPPGLLHAMQATGLTVIPGVLTPTDVMHALDHGAHALKLGSVESSYGNPGQAATSGVFRAR